MSTPDQPHPTFSSFSHLLQYHYKHEGISVSTLLGFIQSNQIDLLVEATALLLNRYSTITHHHSQLSINNQASNVSFSTPSTSTSTSPFNDTNEIQIGTHFDELYCHEVLGLYKGCIPCSSSYYLPYIAIATYNGDLIEYLRLLRQLPAHPPQTPSPPHFDILQAYQDSPYQLYKRTFAAKNPHIPSERRSLYYFLYALQLTFSHNRNQSLLVQQDSSDINHNEYIYHWLGIPIHDQISFLNIIGLTNIEYIYSFFNIIQFIITQTVATANLPLLLSLLHPAQLTCISYVLEPNLYTKFTAQSPKDSTFSSTSSILSQILKHPLASSDDSSQQQQPLLAATDPYGDDCHIYLDLFSHLSSLAAPSYYINPTTQLTLRPGLSHFSTTNPINQQYIMPEFIYIALKSIHPLYTLLWAQQYNTDFSSATFSPFTASNKTTTSSSLLSEANLIQLELQRKALCEAYDSHNDNFLTFFETFWKAPLCSGIQITSPTHVPLYPSHATTPEQLKNYVEMLFNTQTKVRPIKSSQEWRKLWLIEDYCVLYHYITGVIHNHNIALTKIQPNSQSESSLQTGNKKQSTKNNHQKKTQKKTQQSSTITTTSASHIYTQLDIQSNIDIYHHILQELCEIGLNNTNWIHYDPDTTHTSSSSSLSPTTFINPSNESQNQPQNDSTITTASTAATTTTSSPSTTPPSSLPALSQVSTSSLPFLELPEIDPSRNLLYHIHPILPSVLKKELDFYKQDQYLSLPVFTRDRYRLLLMTYLRHNLLSHVHYLLYYTIPIQPVSPKASKNSNDLLSNHIPSLNTPKLSFYTPYPGMINDILGIDVQIYSMLSSSYYVSLKTIQYLLKNKVIIRFRQPVQSTSPTASQTNILYTILLDNHDAHSIISTESNLTKIHQPSPTLLLSLNHPTDPPITETSPTVSNKMTILHFFKGYLERNPTYTPDLTIFEFFQLLNQKSHKFWTSPTTPYTGNIYFNDILFIVEEILLKSKQQAAMQPSKALTDLKSSKTKSKLNPSNKTDTNPNNVSDVKFGQVLLDLEFYYKPKNIGKLLEMLIDSLHLRSISAGIVENTVKEGEYQKFEQYRLHWLSLSSAQRHQYREFVAYIFYLFFHYDNLPSYFTSQPSQLNNLGNKHDTSLSLKDFYESLYSHPSFVFIVEAILVTRNVQSLIQFILTGYTPTTLDFGILMSSTKWVYDISDVNDLSILQTTFFTLSKLKIEFNPENMAKIFDPTIRKQLAATQQENDVVDFFLTQQPRAIVEQSPLHNTISVGFNPILSPFWIKTVDMMETKAQQDNHQYLLELWNTRYKLLPNHDIIEIKQRINSFFRKQWGKRSLFDKVLEIIQQQLSTTAPSSIFSDENITTNAEILQQSVPTKQIPQKNSTKFIISPFSSKHRIMQHYISLVQQTIGLPIPTSFITALSLINTTTTGISVKYNASNTINAVSHPILPFQKYLVPKPFEFNKSITSNVEDKRTMMQIDSENKQYVMNRIYLRSLEQYYLHQRQITLSRAKTLNGIGNQTLDDPNMQTPSSLLNLFYILIHAAGPSLPTLFLQGYMQGLPFSSSNYLCYLLWLYLFPQNDLTHSLHLFPLLSIGSGVGGGFIYQDHLVVKCYQKWITRDVMKRLCVPLLDVSSTSSPQQEQPSTHTSTTTLTEVDNQDVEQDITGETKIQQLITTIVSQGILANVQPTSQLSPSFFTQHPVIFSTRTKSLYIQQLQRTITFLITMCIDVITTTTTKTLSPIQQLFSQQHQTMDSSSSALINSVTVISTTNRQYYSPLRPFIGSKHRSIVHKPLPYTILVDSIRLISYILSFSYEYQLDLFQSISNKDENFEEQQPLSIGIAFSTLLELLTKTIHFSPTILPNLLHILLSNGYPLPEEIYPWLVPQYDLENIQSEDNNIEGTSSMKPQLLNRVERSLYWWVPESPMHFYSFISSTTAHFNPIMHNYISLLLSTNSTLHTSPSSSSHDAPAFTLINTPLNQFNQNYLQSIFLNASDDKHHLLQRFSLFLSYLLLPKQQLPLLTQKSSLQASILQKIHHTTIFGENIWMSLASTYQPRLFHLILSYVRQITLSPSYLTSQSPQLNLSGLLQTDFLERTTLHYFISKPHLHPTMDGTLYADFYTYLMRFFSKHLEDKLTSTSDSHSHDQDASSSVDSDKEIEQIALSILNHGSHNFETRISLFNSTNIPTPFAPNYQLIPTISHKNTPNALATYLFTDLIDKLPDDIKHHYAKVDKQSDESNIPSIPSGSKSELPDEYQTHLLHYTHSKHQLMQLDEEEMKYIYHDYSTFIQRRSLGLPSYVDELGSANICDELCPIPALPTISTINFDDDKITSTTTCSFSSPLVPFVFTTTTSNTPTSITSTPTYTSIDIEESYVLTQLLTFIRDSFYLSYSPSAFDELFQSTQSANVNCHGSDEQSVITIEVIDDNVNDEKQSSDLFRAEYNWVKEYSPSQKSNHSNISTNSQSDNNTIIDIDSYLATIPLPQDQKDAFVAQHTKLLQNEEDYTRAQKMLTQLTEVEYDPNYLNGSVEQLYSNLFLKDLQSLIDHMVIDDIQADDNEL